MYAEPLSSLNLAAIITRSIVSSSIERPYPNSSSAAASEAVIFVSFQFTPS